MSSVAVGVGRLVDEVLQQEMLTLGVAALNEGEDIGSVPAEQRGPPEQRQVPSNIHALANEPVESLAGDRGEDGSPDQALDDCLLLAGQLLEVAVARWWGRSSAG